MIQVTEIFYIVFGVLTLLGGIIACCKAKQWQDLVLGIFFGLTLIAAGILLFYGNEKTPLGIEMQAKVLKIGQILGLLVTAGLSGLYIPKVMMNRAAPHIIIMAVLSGFGLVLTLILFAGYGK